MIARRCTRWAALVAYLTLALGVQLPMPAATTSDELYPCKGHPCGCATAEQCWRHCCCTTLEQRLAWARENYVTPPDFALAEARARGIDWEAYCKVGPEHSAGLPRRRGSGAELLPAFAWRPSGLPLETKFVAGHHLDAGLGLQGRCAKLAGTDHFAAASRNRAVDGSRAGGPATGPAVGASLFDFSIAAHSAAARHRCLNA